MNALQLLAKSVAAIDWRAEVDRTRTFAAAMERQGYLGTAAALREMADADERLAAKQARGAL